MRRRFGTISFLFGVALALAVAQRAAAQSVDISLNYAVNTGRSFGAPPNNNPALTLTVNVGVNGGAAQPYAFDTGSAVFLAPSGVFNAGNRLALGVPVIDTYGGVSQFGGDLYQV
jgi:hypothetical protein